MSSRPLKLTICQKTGWGTRSLSLFLAFVIGLLSIAGVSPVFHGWIHGEIGCLHDCQKDTDTHDPAESSENTAHFCGVTFLQTGVTFTFCDTRVHRRPALRSEFSYDHQKLITNRFYAHFRARAPPIESIV